ncbi:MAG: mechanosensitive ion channel family protein [Chloroflexi bacterium]|nr:mechanosensitive ion channel family protein [Chloroflexota bacterium]
MQQLIGVDIGNLIGIQNLPELVGSIIKAIIILIVALVIARLGRRAIQKTMVKARADRDLATLLGNIVYASVFFLAAVAVLQVFGINLTAVVATLGVIGLAVTFSVQDLLKNFVAGTYLLLERPFRIGDRIRVRDIDGSIESVEFRTTILRTDSGLQVVVPNAIMFSEILTNKSVYGVQQVTLRMEMPQEDLEKVQGQAEAILSQHAQVLSAPEPRATLEGFTDGKLVVRLEFWVSAGTTFGAETILSLQKAFPGANLVVT